MVAFKINNYFVGVRSSAIIGILMFQALKCLKSYS